MKNVRFILLAIAVLGLVGLVSPSAQAAARLKVGIVDFLSKSGEPMPNLGPKVSDALYVSLKATKVFDVVSRDEMQPFLEANNITPPYTETDLALLADGLHLDRLIVGTIDSVDTGEQSKHPNLAITAKMLDVLSFLPTSGAAVSADKTAPEGYTGTTASLFDEVVAQVASDAAYIISLRPTVRGTVLVVDAFGNAFVNAGIQEGAVSGMQMVVLEKIWSDELRRLELRPVGRIRLTTVGPHDSNAVIVPGSKVTTEMEVRGIWKEAYGRKVARALARGRQQETNPATPPAAEHKSSGSSSTSTILALVLIAAGVAIAL